MAFTHHAKGFLLNSGAPLKPQNTENKKATGFKSVAFCFFFANTGCIIDPA
jgi:hypothetical protein